MLQRLAVVMALPPVTRGLDGYNAGFGGFVALLVEELANGAILIRHDFNLFQLKFIVKHIFTNEIIMSKKRTTKK